MAHDDSIGELVEEILETGREPESVCAHRPELLDQVRARLRKIKEVGDRLDLLFPPTEEFDRLPEDGTHGRDLALPSIPGHEVLEAIGRGGMGIVYRARHLALNRDVALKTMLAGCYSGLQERLRFKREAESIAAIRHPHIVQIYEIGEVDGHPFYTMECVEGGSLADRLAGTIQPARESAKMIATLARAVHAAHERGIIHRDLKPANILVDVDDTLKITDFGLARRWDLDSSLTNTGARIGTPSYMAPEQMSGSASIGPPADIFALGAILYEMLTGRPPFRGDSLSDTERRLATEEPAAPSRLNPKLPRDLETICLKCLEKRPASRYPSSAELADDLERFLRHEPIHARPISRPGRWLRWVRRKPLPATLAATFVVLVGLMAIDASQNLAEAAARRAEKARLTSRLESGIRLVRDGRFAEARAIIDQLGDGGNDDLRRRIDRASRDLDLVEDMQALGAERSMALAARDSAWEPGLLAARGYEALFTRSGIGTMAEDPAPVAERIGASDIKEPLLGALDDWAACEPLDTRRGWLLVVARRASTGEGGWQDRCRDPATWADREALSRLAEDATTAGASVEQLRALGDRLSAAGLDALAFRVRVQRAHVDSFLANLALADALRPDAPTEATRYYQAALAIRPHSATAHNNLGLALAKSGRAAEALDEYRQSIELALNAAAPRFNLGLLLSDSQPEEAMEHLRRAIALAPQLALPHRTLGEILLRLRRYDEAEASLRSCLEHLRDDDQREPVLALIRACESNRPGR